MADILGSKFWGVYKVGQMGLALVQYSFCFRMHLNSFIVAHFFTFVITEIFSHKNIAYKCHILL